jgi:ElaB/YqjD/DUF883 family membrane-anchored ribosome-binding protein
MGQQDITGQKPATGHGLTETGPGAQPSAGGKSGAPLDPNSAAGYSRDMSYALGNEQGDSMTDLSRKAQSTWEQTKQAAAEKAGEAQQVVKDRAHRAQQLVMERSEQLRDRADAYVQQDPWRAVAIAASVGVLIGLFLRR